MQFYGPFHHSEFSRERGNSGSYIGNKPEFKNFSIRKSGVYIWGFMFEKYKGDLLDAIDYRNRATDVEFTPKHIQFIPFYVGKGKNISARLNEHKNTRHGSSRMKWRFTDRYYTHFFKDPDFPIKLSTPGHRNNEDAFRLIWNNPNAIEYFNDRRCLKLIYPGIDIFEDASGSFPITNQTIERYAIPDSLFEIVEIKNNFWFCFAPVNTGTSLDQEEAFTFWSLKGYTTGQTLPFNSVNTSVAINIKDHTSTNIFKKGISKVFPGY
jgi:hypothetical protein